MGMVVSLMGEGGVVWVLIGAGGGRGIRRGRRGVGGRSGVMGIGRGTCWRWRKVRGLHNTERTVREKTTEEEGERLRRVG